jgi:hypothetical protein
MCAFRTNAFAVATYRFSMKIISRAEGRSAVAAAAYRAGERLIDERTGEIADFTRRGDVLEREILAPANTPEWVHERERLWNATEAAEKRRDAQVARELQVSLPHELSVEANRELLHGFVCEQFVERGMIADVAMHAAHRGGDERNVHAHVLLTTRTISPEGFAGKERAWNERELLETWRSEWERHVNRALERERVAERVDHRSYAARGIEREAEPKQGPIATRMEREGRRSHAGDDRRAAHERNAERDRLRAEERDVERQEREEREATQRQRDADRRRESEAEQRRGAERERTAGEERVASDRREPGIEHPEPPRWQTERERALSATYERDMRGTALARFWRIERTRDGLAFENARGRFVDRGERVVARDGNDVEVRGMLDVAVAKGWAELTFTGEEAFKRRGMAAALERGFSVRAEGRDAELLREVAAEHDSNIRSKQPERESDMRTIDDLVQRFRDKDTPEPEGTSPLDELIRRQREGLAPDVDHGGRADRDDDRGGR